jgi:hypothetical protein
MKPLKASGEQRLHKIHQERRMEGWMEGRKNGSDLDRDKAEGWTLAPMNLAV